MFDFDQIEHREGKRRERRRTVDRQADQNRFPNAKQQRKSLK